MKLTWLGHSCFAVESGGYRVVLDPYYVESYPPLHTSANEVLCSHHHRDHDFMEAVGTALEVDGELQAAEIGLIAHIGDFLGLACLHQLRDLVHYGLCRCGIGYLVYLYDIFFRVIAPAGAYLEASPAGTVYLLHDAGLHDYLAARGEIRGRQRGHEVALRVADIAYRRLADLGEVEAADLAGHADGYAGVGGD